MFMRRRRSVLLGLFLGASSLLGAKLAQAEGTEQNKSLATDLFDAGVKKMQEGKCDQGPIVDRAVCEEARDLYKRAYALYPEGLGALRNLAYVEKNLGLVASAARSFRELSRRAPLDPKPARRLWADFARKETEVLAARVPHLTLEISGERPQALGVTLDGSPLPDAAWQTPLDLDPGAHVVHAEAPGRTPFEARFELAEGEEKRLTIALPQAGSAEVREPPSLAANAEPRAERTRSSRTLPLIVSGVGLATVGVGLGLGYVAIKKRQDACGDNHFCDPDELESGRGFAKASNFVTGAGAAVLAGGLVWYFLSGHSDGKAPAARVLPSLRAGGATIDAYGSF